MIACKGGRTAGMDTLEVLTYGPLGSNHRAVLRTILHACTRALVMYRPLDAKLASMVRNC